MLRCDAERRGYLMDCVRVAQMLKIKTRVTRDYVTFEFPDRTRAKERKAKKTEREEAEA